MQVLSRSLEEVYIKLWFAQNRLGASSQHPAPPSKPDTLNTKTKCHKSQHPRQVAPEFRKPRNPEDPIEPLTETSKGTRKGTLYPEIYLPSGEVGMILRLLRQRLWDVGFGGLLYIVHTSFRGPSLPHDSLMHAARKSDVLRKKQPNPGIEPHC